ncbi:MAG: M16 family metallopeptidase [Aquificaceae bacterium]
MHELVLENGVKILIKKTRGKGIVSGVIFIKSGVHGETKRGLTNLVSVLLTKRTKDYDSYRIASTFEDYGGSISSVGTDDYVEVSFSTKMEGLDEALKVVQSMLYYSAFDQEDIDREKDNIITAIRSKRESGMELAMEHLRRLTFGVMDYSVSPLGSEEDVSSITRQMVVERWKEVLKGGNVVVSIVGDIGDVPVEDMLRGVFSGIPGGMYNFEQKDVYVESNAVVRVKRPGAQATVLCAFNASFIKDNDYFAFRVLNGVLGNGMTSKLFKELREKRGYAYAKYSYYPTRLFSPRMFAYVGTSPDKAESVLKDLLETVRSSHITEEDVKLAKDKIIGDFLLDHQTRLRQAWYLGFYEVMGMGWKIDQEYPERVKEVSLKDLLRIQKEYLDKYNCVIVEP